LEPRVGDKRCRENEVGIKKKGKQKGATSWEGDTSRSLTDRNRNHIANAEV